jgi:hypothetical protein
MNSLERRMVDVLKDLKENHNVIGAKAEFEAEGTRLEEAMRLKEVVSKAGLDLTIKIGGCEALRDMYEARVIGVSRLVAPMIESPYALKKFLDAKNLVYPADEREQVSFLINIETIDGYNNFDSMLKINEIDDLDGIVLGRGDMACSLGKTRDDINDPDILEITKIVFQKAKQRNMECVIGGGVSADTIPFIEKLGPGLLDRYETRKILFENRDLGETARNGILKAVGFEMMWLRNKRDFYGMIFEEDKQRLEVLQSRYDESIQAAGGMYE